MKLYNSLTFQKVNWCHTEPFQNSCYGPANRQPTTSTSCDSDSHDFSHVASALALVDLFHPVLFLSFVVFFSLRTISLVSVSTPLRGCLNGGAMAQWVEITHASTTITHQVLLPVCPWAKASASLAVVQPGPIKPSVCAALWWLNVAEWRRLNGAAKSERTRFSFTRGRLSL